jgi:hypothetical protein
MATQTETTLKMFHAPHDQMAFKHDRSIQTESGGRHDNLTSQPFAGFEFLSGNAIESFAAEILRRTLNGFSSDPPEQTHPPMHRYPLAFAAIIREGYGGCGRVSKKEKGPRNFSGDRAVLLMVRQNNHLREFCEEPIPPFRQVHR